MGANQMKIPKFNIDYDSDADVIYISFGRPRDGVVCEVGTGDFVRVNPSTDKILGITITDFKYKYLKGNKDIKSSVDSVIPGILKNFHSLRN